ncbi:hypothetical protein ALC60_03756, partial [Trachymyrmex zeteki]
IETSQPRKFFERDSRKGVGVRCGTVGVRSFGALVLGAQRAYRRRLVDRFSRSSRVETMLRGSALCSMAFLSLSLSLSLSLHVRTRKPRAHTYAHARTYAYIHAYTLPQGYACKDTRGLITISACTSSRTRKESEGEMETRNRKRTGCLETPVLRTVLDFTGFSRVRFSFSWLALWNYLRSSTLVIMTLKKKLLHLVGRIL